MRRAHIVLTTVGSLGDLYPFLAIAGELQSRGHRTTVATHEMHRGVVEQAGLPFVDASGMRIPDDLAAFTRQVLHPRRGPRLLIRDMAAADVAASYERLQPICAQADMIVTSTLAFAGQILGETMIRQHPSRWVSVVLTPFNFLSYFDPPTIGVGWIDALCQGPLRGRPLLDTFVAWQLHGLTAPVRRFRRQLGLPAESALGNPLHRGQHAPACSLALFSPLLGHAQSDWPAQAHVTGFAAHAPPHTGMDASLTAFLQAGPAPIVFSLGSTAAHVAGEFLRESMRGSAALGRRALLFTGSPQTRAELPETLPDFVHAVEYAPHAEVFSHAAAIVHHGGIGTSSEALRAGRPMLVVPHGFDQFDNARRLERLGIAQSLTAARYRYDSALPRLQALLENPEYAHRADKTGNVARQEHGARVAADRIEMQLATM